MREPPSILEEHLRACLQDQYDLNSVTLEFLPLEHDYNAGVYRAVSKQGTVYLLKVTSRPLYENFFHESRFHTLIWRRIASMWRENGLMSTFGDKGSDGPGAALVRSSAGVVSGGGRARRHDSLERDVRFARLTWLQFHRRF